MNQNDELVSDLVPNLVKSIIPPQIRFFPLVITDDEEILITDDENLIVMER